jgi:hypothetical protein
MHEPTLDELGLKYGTDKASSGHNYLSRYEEFLKPLRQEAFNLIEIGGLNGASLFMWREYFPNANIVCLDINPEVRRFAGERIQVEIGDAGNAKFLREIAAKVGKAKLVLDDGSHRWDHHGAAFRTLFHILEPDGIYIVEDLHTSYEGRYAGEAIVPFTQSLFDIVNFMNAYGDARRYLAHMLSPHILRPAMFRDVFTLENRA